MSFSEPKSVTVPEIALIAATRGAIGFGAGLLLATGATPSCLTDRRADRNNFDWRRGQGSYC